MDLRSTPTPALQRFIDDELMRVPLIVDQVIDATLSQLRRSIALLAPDARASAADIVQRLPANRQHVVDCYVRSLSQQLGVQRLPSAAQPQQQQRQDRMLALAPEDRGLSLVDEDEVAVDVEMARTIEAIRSEAEYELRELQTFVSALVGDMDVARDHNPLRPEVHARALCASAAGLPLSRGHHLLYVRNAGPVLAQVLRRAYAGASSRLEAAGVEPAAHRTLILPAGSRRSRPVDATVIPDLHGIRERMPVREPAPAHVRTAAVLPPPALEDLLRQGDEQWRNLPAASNATERSRLREAQRLQLVQSAASAPDQQVIELLTRLFDVILSDRTLAADTQLLLARMQAPALRVALRDPKTLDDDSHPLWKLMDRIAFLGETLPRPGAAGDAVREQALRRAQSVVDHAIAEPQQTAALYEWAGERLAVLEQHRFEQRCSAAAAEIALLQPLEDRLTASQAPPSTLHGALDLGQLDTVPADLLDAAPGRHKPAAAAQSWLAQRRPGHWVRVFLQGGWVNAQLLWPGERGELWLFGDGGSARTWAVRRRAVLMLHDEGLLDTLPQRSLVQTAAKALMRRMARAA